MVRNASLVIIIITIVIIIIIIIHVILFKLKQFISFSSIYSTPLSTHIIFFLTLQYTRSIIFINSYPQISLSSVSYDLERKKKALKLQNTKYILEFPSDERLCNVLINSHYHDTLFSSLSLSLSLSLSSLVHHHRTD